jgi:hypothetical protein
VRFLLVKVVTISDCFFLISSLSSRERNRVHAKMTRDRKKCFVSTIEKTISDLEADITRMKTILNDKQDDNKIIASSPVLSSLTGIEQVTRITPFSTPELCSSKSTMSSDDANKFPKLEHLQPPMKRVCHGFCTS